MDNKMKAKILPVALFLVGIIVKVFGFSSRKVPRLISFGRKSIVSSEQSINFSTDEIQQYHIDSLAFYHAMRNCKDAYISKHVNKALDVLTDAVRLYGTRNLLSSYNGGKDADVVMHLLRAVAAKFEHDSGVECRPKLVYFAIEDEFPDVVDHIELTKRLYDLDIVQYDCGIIQVSVHINADVLLLLLFEVLNHSKQCSNVPLQRTNQQGLKQHVESMNESSASTSELAAPAFILGTRKGDPNCGDQETFAPSR